MTKKNLNNNIILISLCIMIISAMFIFYLGSSEDILINIKEVKKLYLKYFDVPQKDYIKNNLNIMHNRLINRLGIEEYSKIDITFNNFLLLIDEFS